MGVSGKQNRSWCLKSHLQWEIRFVQQVVLMKQFCWKKNDTEVFAEVIKDTEVLKPFIPLLSRWLFAGHQAWGVTWDKT